MNSPSPLLSNWLFKALIFSIIAATAGYLLFSVWSGWQEVTAAFITIGISGACIALLLSLVNYGLRFIRWQMYLQHLEQPVQWQSSLRIYLSGFALTTTPGKAGEAFRGVLLKQYGVPYPVTFAMFLSERLSDLIAIVLLTLLGLSQYPQAQGMVLIGLLGIVAVLIGISSKSLLTTAQRWAEEKNGRLFKLLAHLFELLSLARRCHSPRVLIIVTFLSLIAWAAEALAFHWVLQWLGADISLEFAVFIYALSMLVGGLSFLPGGLGSAEAVMIALLVLKGMAMPTAVAATVFIRLATLWFAVLIGLFALYKSRHRKVI